MASEILRSLSARPGSIAVRSSVSTAPASCAKARLQTIVDCLAAIHAEPEPDRQAIQICLHAALATDLDGGSGVPERTKRLSALHAALNTGTGRS